MNHRDQARGAVRTELAARRWEPADLSRAADADRATINDFLEGRRWPRLTTLAKIDTALGWEPGTIDRIAATGEPPTVSPVEQALAGILLDLKDDAYADLTEAERDEAIAAAKLTFLERARQIRRTRES